MKIHFDSLTSLLCLNHAVSLISCQVKHERLKGYTDLRILEKEYCDRMCLPPLNIGSVVVPSEEHLRELENNIKMLQDEQVR